MTTCWNGTRARTTSDEDEEEDEPPSRRHRGRQSEAQGLLSPAAMNYVSTRGQAPVRDFAGVLLAGLAEDGGLYVPESWPHSLAGRPAWRCGGCRTTELAARVLQPFVGGSIGGEALRADVPRGVCRIRAAPPWRRWCNWKPGCSRWSCSTGRRLAFKDMAMQLLGRLFDHVLAARGAAGHDRGGDVGGHGVGGDRGMPGPRRSWTS